MSTADSIAETQGVNNSTDEKLGLGIAALNRAHYLGSFFLREIIQCILPNFN